MYTLDKSITINTTIIPVGAQVVRYDEFLWAQLMESIYILCDNYPNEQVEIGYQTEDNSCLAILDGHQNLYIWKDSD